MDRRLPRVVSPEVPIALVDDRQVLLLTVESWPDRVRVRLAVLQDEATDNLDAEFLELAARSNQGRRAVEMPGAVFFSQVQFSIHDEAATSYKPHTTSVSGTGSEWGAEWLFRPGIPAGVREVQVIAHTATGDQAVSVDLGNRPSVPLPVAA
jgi:hypothetical protein